jgi:hypothetical protein
MADPSNAMIAANVELRKGSTQVFLISQKFFFLVYNTLFS